MLVSPGTEQTAVPDTVMGNEQGRASGYPLCTHRKVRVCKSPLAIVARWHRQGKQASGELCTAFISKQACKLFLMSVRSPQAPTNHERVTWSGAPITECQGSRDVVRGLGTEAAALGQNSFQSRPAL